MEHSFLTSIAGRDYKLNSMNVKEPVLFQVYTEIGGKIRRFHIKLVDGIYQFAMREDVPPEILAHEEDLGYVIIERYKVQ